MKLVYYFLMFFVVFLSTNITTKTAIGAVYELVDDSGDNNSQVSMQDTVRAVLRTHKDLKAIQENRQVALHNLRAAKAGYGPRVDIVGNSSVSDLNDATLERGGYGTGRIEVLLTQPIWDGFATRSRVRSGEYFLQSTASRVIDNATTLALDGIIAHVNLIWRQQNLKLAQDNVRAHERILALTSERQATGADTLANVTQTKGRLINAMSALETAKSSLIQGEDSYVRFTGMSAPSDLGPVKQPQMFTEQEEVLNRAKLTNPKVLAFLADMRTAQAEKQIIQSSYYPTINLEAGAGSGTHESDGEWINSFDVGATFRWNVFNSGADWASTQAASAAIREARQVAYSFMDDLTLQIKNSWIDYETAVKQLAFHEEAMVYNQQTLDFYTEQFSIGTRSLLDLLDAESELYNSEVQALTARANIIVSSYTIYALTGLLLDELGIAPDEVLIAPTE